MKYEIYDGINIRIGALVWYSMVCGGSISTLILVNFPQSFVAKLIATIFAILGLIAGVQLSNKRPFVEKGELTKGEENESIS